MKLSYFLFLCFLLKSSFLFSQTPYVLKGEDTEIVKNFEVLPDENYTFEQVLTDSSLEFIKNPALLSRELVDNHDYLWIRFLIQNNSYYSKKIYFIVVPYFNNTIYTYSKKEKNWKTIQRGLEVLDYQRAEGFNPIFINSRKVDTVFAKVKISPLREHKNELNMIVHIKKESYFINKEQTIFVIWMVSLVTISLFFLYNLYLYLVFKDKPYLYYLFIMVGGVLYISSSLFYFDLLLPFKIFEINIETNHILNIFDLNLFVNQISISLILFGFVKFTNFYIDLYKNFPKWNRVLHYILYTYIVSSLITSSLTISGIYFFNILPIIASYNIVILLITTLLIWLGIRSLWKGYKPARYFLLANGFPLLTIVVVTICLFDNPDGIQLNSRLFTCIGLLVQSLTFAVALAARINLIKDELKEKQLEAQKLEAENEKIIARNRYIELENEYIIADMITAVNKETELKQQITLEINQKTELEQKIKLEAKQKADLQAKLEANQRELTANSLYLYQKNELLTNLQKQIENLSYKDTTTHNREGIKEIKSAIKNDIQLESDWDNFKIHFEQVHPSFFKELNEKYPTLTKNELRLSAYYHLNMSVKEIAALLNINPRSVHVAKSRLNKKMEAIDNQN